VEQQRRLSQTQRQDALVPSEPSDYDSTLTVPLVLSTQPGEDTETHEHLETPPSLQEPSAINRTFRPKTLIQMQRHASYIEYQQQEEREIGKKELAECVSNFRKGKVRFRSHLFETEKTKMALLKKSLHKMKSVNSNSIALFHGIHKATATFLAGILFLFPLISNYTTYPAWPALTAFGAATTFAGNSFKRGYLCFSTTITTTPTPTPIY